MKKIVPNFIITLTVVGLMIAAILYVRSSPLFNINLFSTNYLNATVVYQLTTLALALVIVLITALQTGFKSLRLLSIARIDGEVTPEPWIGITEKNKDTWKRLGLSVGLIISAVTAIVIYFQVMNNGVVNDFAIGSFALVVLLALNNSFVEEVTFRHTFASIVEHHKLNPNISKGLSAVIFGTVHYWGYPARIPGVIMAGFIGWFLSKSIHETKGFFWAWMIHFVQDVIIMTALFLTLA
ncbi:MAG: CPBP family intramembrane metalloprotease [Actinomycetaceae bacterium]|nr:CPBP family intramembrane metalloprotease [Actinomycetaceae bacterium]